MNDDSVYLRLVGRRIRDARDQKELTLEELGELAGLNKETVNRIELGASAGLIRVAKLAEALGLPYSYVFSDDRDLTRPPVDQQSGPSATGGSPTDEQRAEVPTAVERDVENLLGALASIETAAEGILAVARTARGDKGGRAAPTKPRSRRPRRASG